MSVSSSQVRRQFLKKKQMADLFFTAEIVHAAGVKAEKEICECIRSDKPFRWHTLALALAAKCGQDSPVSKFLQGLPYLSYVERLSNAQTQLRPITRTIHVAAINAAWQSLFDPLAPGFRPYDMDMEFYLNAKQSLLDDLQNSEMIAPSAGLAYCILAKCAPNDPAIHIFETDDLGQDEKLQELQKYNLPGIWMRLTTHGATVSSPGPSSSSSLALQVTPPSNKRGREEDEAQLPQLPSSLETLSSVAVKVAPQQMSPTAENKSLVASFNQGRGCKPPEKAQYLCPVCAKPFTINLPRKGNIATIVMRKHRNEKGARCSGSLGAPGPMLKGQGCT